MHLPAGPNPNIGSANNETNKGESNKKPKKESQEKLVQKQQEIAKPQLHMLSRQTFKELKCVICIQYKCSAAASKCQR